LFKITDLPVQGSCLAALLACNFAAKGKILCDGGGTAARYATPAPCGGGMAS